MKKRHRIYIVKMGISLGIILAAVVLELIFIFIANALFGGLDSFSSFLLVEHRELFNYYVATFQYLNDKMLYILFFGIIVMVIYFVFKYDEDEGGDEDGLSLVHDIFGSNITASVLAIIGILLTILFGILSYVF